MDLELEETGNNKAKAARILGIGPNTLWRRLKSREAAKSRQQRRVT